MHILLIVLHICIYKAHYLPPFTDTFFLNTGNKFKDEKKVYDEYEKNKDSFQVNLTLI